MGKGTLSSLRGGGGGRGATKEKARAPAFEKYARSHSSIITYIESWIIKLLIIHD